MSKDPLAKSSDRMISAVTTNSVGEEDIRLFRCIVATDLLVEEIFRTRLSGYVMTYATIDLAHPIMQHVNGRVLNACVEIIVLDFGLQRFVVGVIITRRVRTPRSLDVLHHDSLDLFYVPADRLSGFFILNKVIQFM